MTRLEAPARAAWELVRSARRSSSLAGEIGEWHARGQ
jgi:hypothetical protein